MKGVPIPGLYLDRDVFLCPLTVMVDKIKEFVLGKAKNPLDPQVYHNASLTAFFAWVGLGADGLSSSCYGPEEAFLSLGHYTHLAIFLAIAVIFTVFILS